MRFIAALLAIKLTACNPSIDLQSAMDFVTENTNLEPAPLPGFEYVTMRPAGLYRLRDRTIYVSRRLRGSFLERSVVVHEMTHYLQHMNETLGQCEADEIQAFTVQQRYFEQFGLRSRRPNWRAWMASSIGRYCPSGLNALE